MPIRAQCDNCGKVYNLPDQSAGKRLRCKQCAVAFTVPDATAPAAAPARAVTVTVPAAQKICVVCGQDVAGRPRTKDQAGNYYCRACYEEKARSREQLAQSRVGAPVGAGVGGGDDGGDMIDLSTLEPTEQFDESAQPPPPPIPDMDMVAPPLPDMGGEPILAEPVMAEVPKPKKKKKKKKGAAAASKGGAGSFLSKIGGLPYEIWVIAVAAIAVMAAMINHSLAPQVVIALIVMGVAGWIWGHIGIVMAAFAEDSGTGIKVMFLPFYQLFFILSNWSVVQRSILRIALGVVFMIAGGAISVKFVKDAIDEYETQEEERVSKDWSSDPNFKLLVDLDAPPGGKQEYDVHAQSVADAILASFKKRGVKPPEGMKYIIHASAERGVSDKDKIQVPMGSKQMKMPAPMLTYTLAITDQTEAPIYEQTKDVVVPKDLYTSVSDEERNAPGYLNKVLWKGMVSEFEALAAGVPVNGAAPAGANGNDPSKTATPSGNSNEPAK